MIDKVDGGTIGPVFDDWRDYFENAAQVTEDFEAATDEMRREEAPLEHREPFD